MVMSQIAAEHYCRTEYPSGKGLASIHTEADQAAAVQACGQLDLSKTWDGSDNDGKPSGCWIGLTDNDNFPEKWATEGQFEWTDGSPVDFARWGTGEPSNSLHGGQGEAASGEDGVTLTWVASAHPSGWWNDAHDTGFTASNGCTTCSETQNKLAAGNYPLCQTGFPADADINRKAQRICASRAYLFRLGWSRRVGLTQRTGRNRQGIQGVHLNPLSTSIEPPGSGRAHPEPRETPEPAHPEPLPTQHLFFPGRV